jgi:hypothetical protein
MAGALLGIAACGGAQAQDFSEPPAFNKLTYAVIDEDRRGIRLFGINDPQGPKAPIPYARMMAEALRLPEEKGDGTDISSVPAFSLEPSAAFRRASASLREKFPRMEDLLDAVGGYLQAHPDAYDEFTGFQMEQSLPKIRVFLQQLLYERMERAQVDEIVARIANVDNLMATLRLLQRNGKLRESDDAKLARYIAFAMQVFRTTPGNMVYLPQGTIEAVLGQTIYSEPVFSGVDSRTQIARIVFEADVALKSLGGTAGYELKKKLPFHQSSLEWSLKSQPPSQRGVPSTSAVLIQVVPRNIALQVSADERVVAFGNVDVGIRLKPFEARQPLSGGLATYGDFLSAHYEDYAREIAPFWEFRELAKVLAAARYLKRAGLRMDTPPDRSWTPVARVPGQWYSMTVGLGADQYDVVVGVIGGVSLQVQGQTRLGNLSISQADRLRLAGAQLDAVLQSGGSGVCYDGQPGCSVGSSLGTVRIEGRPRGSQSLPPELVARWGQTPEGRELLEKEKALKTQLEQAEAKVAEIKRKRDAATDAAARSVINVEYANAEDAKNRVNQQVYVTVVQVEAKAKQYILK